MAIWQSSQESIPSQCPSPIWLLMWPDGRISFQRPSVSDANRDCKSLINGASLCVIAWAPRRFEMKWSGAIAVRVGKGFGRVG